MKTRHNPSSPARQHGVALVIALVLLVVATLIGVSGMSNITLQERMTTNLYDRSLALQAAEAAQRIAAQAILQRPEGPTWDATKEWLDCEPELNLPDPGTGESKKKGRVKVTHETGADVVACQTVPANTFTGAALAPFDWFAVTTFNDAFELNDLLSAGTPEFHVQYMGESLRDDQLGQNRRAEGTNYGESSLTPVRNYRVFSRSHNPSSDNVQQRSLLVIETTLQRLE